MNMNVPPTERMASAMAGAGLIAAALLRRGIGKWAMLALGGALLRRGWTGHCDVYERLQMDRRHPAKGVPGNRGIRVEHAVEVNCSPEALYDFWRNLEQLPKVMRHVESVRRTGRGQSHWRVKAPMRQAVEWDAEIINDEPGRLIAWQSLPGATVRNAGSVWFEPTAHGATRVKVAMEYDPPAGALGNAVAEWLGASPQRDLAEDLARFKQFAERELTMAFSA